MQHTPLPNGAFALARHAFALARQAVFSGRPIPAAAAAQLEALGVDVGALEIRLKQTDAFGH